MGAVGDMDEQRGARWLAREARRLGADSADAGDVSPKGGSPNSGDDPPPGFKFFECISESKIAPSVAALRDLGFEVNGERRGE